MKRAVLTRRAMLAGTGALAAVHNARGATSATPSSTSLWSRLELVDAEDQAFRLGEGIHRATLIHLWANWCPICMNEMRPVYDTLSELLRRGIGVLLVSSPHDWDTDRKAAASLGPGPTYARPSERNGPGIVRSALFSAEGWYYVPRSLLFDHGKGQVVWSHVGGLDWSGAPKLERLLSTGA